MVDILSIIIDELRTNIDIKNLIGITSSADYYKVRNESQPEVKTDKWITVRSDWDRSEAVLPADSGLIIINCYIKDSLLEPYKKLRELSNKIKEIINKQNRGLDVGVITVYQIVKTNIRDFYEEDTHLWRGLLTFEFVTYENNPA